MKSLNVIMLNGAVPLGTGGSGGGVIINNQNKEIEITENGTTEVVADSEYTGLGKVTVNVDVLTESEEDNIPIKDVMLYDYDGTTLYAYTKEEIQELTELPTPPEHDGLVFEGWNYSLDEIKTLGYACVGALYDTFDKKTRLYVNIDNELKKEASFALNLWSTNSDGVSIKIDWGDGSIDSGYIYYNNTQVNTNHTYENLGKYTITIETDGNYLISVGSFDLANHRVGSRGDIYQKMELSSYVTKATLRCRYLTFISSCSTRFDGLHVQSLKAVISTQTDFSFDQNGSDGFYSLKVLSIRNDSNYIAVPVRTKIKYFVYSAHTFSNTSSSFAFSDEVKRVILDKEKFLANIETFVNKFKLNIYLKDENNNIEVYHPTYAPSYLPSKKVNFIDTTGLTKVEQYAFYNYEIKYPIIFIDDTVEYIGSYFFNSNYMPYENIIVKLADLDKYFSITLENNFTSNNAISFYNKENELIKDMTLPNAENLKPYLLSKVEINKLFINHSISVERYGFYQLRAGNIIVDDNAVVTMDGSYSSNSYTCNFIKFGKDCSTYLIKNIGMSSSSTIVVCTAAEPPTLYSSFNCKELVVPQDSIELYKSATNWSSLASKITGYTDYIIFYSNEQGLIAERGQTWSEWVNGGHYNRNITIDGDYVKRSGYHLTLDGEYVKPSDIIIENVNYRS